MEKQLHILLLVVSLVLTARPADGQGTISTVAGSTWVFCCNGGPGVNATLGTLSGVAVDSAGNIYAFDSDNNFAVRVTPAGVLAIVAGNGTSGFSGDGGPATNAAFGDPPNASGLAADAAGNLFIADTANNRVRKVAPNGIISTVAGNGAPDFSGDGGPATRASLNHPNGVAVDASGNLFIADGENYRIRKVTPDGVISTLAALTAGASSVSLTYPTGMAVDSAGNIFAAFSPAGFVRKATPDGLISTVAGNGTFGSSGDGGPATAAAMNPIGVAVDPAGNIFIGEDHRIRKIGRDGIIWTVAGDGTAGFSGDGGAALAARLYSTGRLAADSGGNLLIADSRNRRIRKITPAGMISTVAGNGLYYFGGDGGSATAGWLRYPGGVAVDLSGNIFISDAGNQRIRRVAPNGIISTLAGNGVLGFSGDGGPATAASLYDAAGLAADAAGNVFFADVNNYRVRKVTPNGGITTVAGRDSVYNYSGDGGPATAADLRYPGGVAVDGAGNVFIADTGNYRVRKVTPDGDISTVAGIGSPAGWNPYGRPWSFDGVPATLSGVYADAVAVDSKGNLFIAGGGRVRKVSPDGIITTIAGGSGSVCPGDSGPATLAALSAVGVAVDAAGNIFAADSANNRIRKIAPDGTIWTVAGNGTSAFSGDGGPATRAGLSANGVAVDNAGSLYIADFINNRIRKVLNPIDSADVPCVPPAPSFSARLRNSASHSNDIAAGSIASLYGSNLTPAFSDWEQATGFPLPISLKDVTVQLNGIAAPLLYVSWSQVNLLVPWELMGQNPIYADVTVKGISVSTGTDPVQYFTINRAAPGVFFGPGLLPAQGVVQIANTAIFAAPVTSTFLPGRPAKRGEYVTIWCTGLGDVTNRPPSGAAASSIPLSVTLAMPTVTIGGKAAAVSFSGLAPGFVGLYQINAQVPADAPVGERVPLTVTQAGVLGNTVVIAVQ